jgi:glutaredoxin 3
VAPASQIIVNLYVVPDCPLCARARDWLNGHGISYVECDVANNFGALRRMYELTRQRLVPIIEVDGRALVRPDDEALTNLLL